MSLPLEAAGQKPGAVDPAALGEFVCDLVLGSEMAVGCVEEVTEDRRRHRHGPSTG